MNAPDTPSSVTGPALAIIELASLARAAVTLDAIVKRAPVHLHTAERVSPGKFLIIIVGGVAEVEEGFRAGIAAADDVVVAELFLPQPHQSLRMGLESTFSKSAVDSLGIFETYNACSSVRALDTALKSTGVDLVGLHLCSGVGGKAYWAVSGELYAIEEAIEIAVSTVPQELMVSSEVIGAPHPEAVIAYLRPFG